MKSLQDNLVYYQQQKQTIINNKANYQSTRTISEYGAWQQGSHIVGRVIPPGHGVPIAWFPGLEELMKPELRKTIAKTFSLSLDEIHPDIKYDARLYSFDGNNLSFNGTVYYQHRKLNKKEERFFDQAKYNQALKECENNITSTQGAIDKLLQSANDSQRAAYLADLFGMDKATPTIELIKSLGFDANELANIAVNKNNQFLFDLALQHGADCCSHFVGGITLLQRIIHEGKELFLQKVLSKNQDLDDTLMNAIKKDDILTIDKLLSLKPELLKQKYAGYTLLQIAIATEGSHTEVIKKILSFDKKLAEVLSDNNESALRIAVRIGDKEVIKLVSLYANINVELEQFGNEFGTIAKTGILANRDFVEIIKLHKYESNGHSLANYRYGNDLEVEGLGYDNGHKDDI